MFGHYIWLGYDYDPHWQLIALTVGLSLVGIVTFGSLAGSMLPFLLRRLGSIPPSASAPFVATLVDVTGLIIYFLVACCSCTECFFDSAPRHRDGSNNFERESRKLSDYPNLTG